MKANDRVHSDIFICSEEHTKWHDQYFEQNTIVDSPLCQVHRMGVESALPKLFCIKRKTPKYGVVFCVIRGMGQLTIENKKYNLMPNDVFILPKGMPHSYQSDPNVPMGTVWCEFIGGDSHVLLERIYKENGPILHGICLKTATSICAMLDESSLVEHYDGAVSLYSLLVNLWQHISKQKQGKLELIPTNGLDRIEAYIYANIKKPIQNQILAEKCGVSIQYFLRIFKEQFGKSPQIYIQEKRIDLAKVALTQTELTLQEIALDLGYCNASHLIRRFKQVTGLKPLEYKQINSKQYQKLDEYV